MLEFRVGFSRYLLDPLAALLPCHPLCALAKERKNWTVLPWVIQYLFGFYTNTVKLPCAAEICRNRSSERVCGGPGLFTGQLHSEFGIPFAELQN